MVEAEAGREIPRGAAVALRTPARADYHDVLFLEWRELRLGALGQLSQRDEPRGRDMAKFSRVLVGLAHVEQQRRAHSVEAPGDFSRRELAHGVELGQGRKVYGRGLRSRSGWAVAPPGSLRQRQSEIVHEFHVGLARVSRPRADWKSSLRRSQWNGRGRGSRAPDRPVLFVGKRKQLAHDRVRNPRGAASPPAKVGPAGTVNQQTIAG